MAKSTKARAAAFAKPATGQATPGALSKAPSKNPSPSGTPRQSVMPSMPNTGVDRAATPQAAPSQAPALAPAPVQSFENTMTPALRAKVLADTARLAAAASAPAPTTPPADIHMGNKPTGIQEGEPVKPQDPDLLNRIPILGDIRKAIMTQFPDPMDRTFIGAGSVRVVGNGAQMLSEILSNAPKAGVVEGGNVLTRLSLKSYNTIKNFIAGQINPSKVITTTNSISGKTSQVTIQESLKGGQAARVGLVLAGTAALAAWLLKESIGGKNMGEFTAQEEGSQVAGMGLFIADKNGGTYEDYLELRGIQDEALNASISAVPFFGGTREGTASFVDTTRKTMAVLDRIRADQEKARLAGEDEGAMWTRINAEKEAAQLAKEQRAREAVDYYNSEKIRTEEKILALRAASSGAERDARQRELEAEAAFWEEQRRLRLKMEAEAREEEAKFWMQYRELSKKLDEESRPSKLGFGLFR